MLSVALVLVWIFHLDAAVKAQSAPFFADVGSMGVVGAPVVVEIDQALLDRAEAVEIGSTDMSELAEVFSGALRVSPVTPLEPGPHELKVYGETADGFDVIARFAFTIERDAPPSPPVAEPLADAEAVAESEFDEADGGAATEQGLSDDALADDALADDALSDEAEGAADAALTSPPAEDPTLLEPPVEDALAEAAPVEQTTPAQDEAFDGSAAVLPAETERAEIEPAFSDPSQSAARPGLAFRHTGVAEANRRNVREDWGQSAASHAGDIVATFEEDRLQANVRWLATALKEQRIDPDSAADISEYQVASRETVGAFVVRSVLGDQTIDYDLGLVSGMTRRGLSIDAASEEYGVGLSLFGTRSQTSIGSDNVIGVEEESDRMYGARLAWRPFRDADFSLSATGYFGNGSKGLELTPPPGAATTADAASSGGLGASEGRGASIGAEGSLFDYATRYRFLAAATEWDEDGDRRAFESEHATAFFGELEQTLWQGEESFVTALAGYERTEEPFETLGASGLLPGFETFRGQLDYNGGAVSLRLSGDRQLSNIGGPADVEQDEFINAAVDLGLTPYQSPEDPAWLNGVTFDFGYGFAAVERWRNGSAATPAPGADSTTHTLFGGFSVYDEGLSWSARLDAALIDDEAQVGEDSSVVTLNLGLNGFRPVRWAEFAVTASSSYTDSDLDAIHFDGDVIVNSRFILEPGLFALTLDGQYRTAGAPGSGPDGHRIASGLSWTPFDGRFELAIEGGYAADSLAVESDPISNEDDEWFGGATLRADTSWAK